jgi:hypothetical protein
VVVAVGVVAPGGARVDVLACRGGVVKSERVEVDVPAKRAVSGSLESSKRGMAVWSLRPPLFLAQARSSSRSSAEAGAWSPGVPSCAAVSGLGGRPAAACRLRPGVVQPGGR